MAWNNIILLSISFFSSLNNAINFAYFRESTTMQFDLKDFSNEKIHINKHSRNHFIFGFSLWSLFFVILTKK